MTGYGESIPFMVHQEPQDEQPEGIIGGGEGKDEGEERKEEGKEDEPILCINANAPREIVVAVVHDRADVEFDDIVYREDEERHDVEKDNDVED